MFFTFLYITKFTIFHVFIFMRIISGVLHKSSITAVIHLGSYWDVRRTLCLSSKEGLIIFSGSSIRFLYYHVLPNFEGPVIGFTEVDFCREIHILYLKLCSFCILLHRSSLILASVHGQGRRRAALFFCLPPF